MNTYAVTYHYATGSDDARNETRPAHLDYLRQAHDRGHVYMAGRVVSEVPKALLVFDTEGVDEVERIIEADPFYTAGLIDSYVIEEWIVGVDPRTA